MTLPTDVAHALPSRYREDVSHPIASGGQADVHVVDDAYLSRKAALKVVRAYDRPFLEREFRALAAVSSKHVIQVYDAVRDSAGDVLALLLEYLPGPDLSAAWTTSNVPTDQALLLILWQVAQGLRSIHGHGHVHHDLKPHNLRYDQEGLVKICDFGLVRNAGSHTGTPFGTHGYLAPELASYPHQITPAIDIWAFGCSAFRLATGHLPASLMAFPPSTPPTFAAIRASLPVPAIDILDQCLEHDPEDRPTADEIARDLAKSILCNQHRGLLCHGDKYWVVDGSNRSIALKAGSARFRVEYNSFDFDLTVQSGTVRINNQPCGAGPALLSEGCVISVDSSTHISFAASHPEIIL